MFKQDLFVAVIIDFHVILLQLMELYSQLINFAHHCYKSYNLNTENR